jgi:hypothetical protein
MAGTIPLSLTQQLDEYGQPLSGGQLYIIQAGTISTPQNAYQDTALSILMPNPMTLDAAGRIPQFFLADGQIKVRLQNVNGVVKFQQDNLLVIGPSAGGGGGGGSVDPTTVMQTGDVKLRYDNAIISGFVRINGKTIGSASSGATELADPSAQGLFNYLWAKDTTLVVTPGGRGVSAAADWAANKQLTLPDGRNRLLMALADMGNTDVGLLASNTFTKGNQTTLGSMLGVGRHLLSAAEVPVITPTGAVGVSFTISGYVPTQGFSGANQSGLAAGVGNNNTGTYNVPLVLNYSASATLTMNAFGGGQFHEIANPALLITVYMKL